jgi:hypothetical protein
MCLDHWKSGLCRSSDVLQRTEPFGNLIYFRRQIEDGEAPTQSGQLGGANLDRYQTDATEPEDGKRSSFRKVVFL